MQKALLLHGTNGSSTINWLPWLKQELENSNWLVWVPDLPQADQPNIKRYNQYFESHKLWELDEQTTIIGHSSGAVAALGLLQSLPETTKIGTVILIGSFKDDLGWPSLGGLFEEPFDFDKIKRRCGKFLFIHSNDDPYCPLDHAEFLAKALDGDLKVIPGQKHFSEETDPKYTTFPLLRAMLLGGD